MEDSELRKYMKSPWSRVVGWASIAAFVGYFFAAERYKFALLMTACVLCAMEMFPLLWRGARRGEFTRKIDMRDKQDRVSLKVVLIYIAGIVLFLAWQVWRA